METIKSLIVRKKPNILLFILADICILTVSSFLAIWLRFDFGTIPDQYFINSYRYLIFDVAIMLIMFSMLNLYTSVWRYASVIELIKIIMACTFFEIFNFLYKALFTISMPRSYFLLQLLMMIAMVCSVRFGYRVARTLLIHFENKSKKKKAMLVGAGDAGRLIIEEMMNNTENSDTQIVCVVDDDRAKQGQLIRGIKICGISADIKDLTDEYEIEQIIIAMPSATKEEIARIVEECHKTKCEIKILPSVFKTLNGKNIVNSIRPLSYEDFLGRDQIVVNNDEIKESIKDKVVLVTGGGGSIGSELCRQIAKADPKTLIIFDIYENNAYDIQQELFRNYPKLDLLTFIGSVRDYDRLEKVFEEYEPDIVFHAAAHKHVPLMEESPNEAIKNNCLGTFNTCKLAAKYHVKKFVLISTDKAVRPTNVMGASKRICEMIIQTFDKTTKGTDFVAVRFGNVLGSNGSVIPLFLKQIENGGPVTVTHKDITRFFMTIPEAVSLVLQAECYAEGGEIFVLDMGEPVKIYDLAEKLIRYKGYEPNIDIQIEITGLRPGEKLYEEILMDEEGMKETPNKLIHIGQPLKISKTFLKDLEDLIHAAYENEDDIKDKVAKIVKTYKVDKRRDPRQLKIEEKVS